MYLLVGNDDRKLGTEEFAQTASHTLVLVRDDRKIIPLPVELVGFLEHLQRAEFNADLTALTQIFGNLYQFAASPMSFKQTCIHFTNASSLFGCAGLGR